MRLSFETMQQTAVTARPLVVPGGWARVSGLQPGRDMTVYLQQPGVSQNPVALPRNAYVVSTASLLGRLLMGRCAGDTVVFHAAGGRVHLMIRDAGSSIPFDNDNQTERPGRTDPLLNLS